MPWLVRDGEVLATLEVADSAHARGKGLLGRDDFEGAILLQPAKSVHTLGMRFAIDVAFLDKDMVVLRTVTMHKWRLGRPVPKAAAVIEAEAGAFASWNLQVGDALEVKG
ncbi:MAG: uncharacterized protein QOE63_103 [Acidimicrobiaceae bacterium]|jgi:uncharacterized membrane protein (UPF0127 family)